MSQMLLLDKRTQSLIEDYVPQGDILEGVVCFFSVFADYTRIKILSALAISELCVTDLSRILELNQTTVSHQLRFLKSAGIVRCCRQGKVIFYSLTNDSINDVLLKGIEFLGCKLRIFLCESLQNRTVWYIIIETESVARIFRRRCSVLEGYERITGETQASA